MDDSGTDSVSNGRRKNARRKLVPWRVNADSGNAGADPNGSGSGSGNGSARRSPDRAAASDEATFARGGHPTRIPAPPKGGQARKQAQDDDEVAPRSPGASIERDESTPLPSQGYVRPVKRLPKKQADQRQRPDSTGQDSPALSHSTAASDKSKLRRNVTWDENRRQLEESDADERESSVSSPHQSGKKPTPKRNGLKKPSEKAPNSSESVLQESEDERMPHTPDVADLLPAQLGRNLSKALETFRKNAYALFTDLEPSNGSSTFRKVPHNNEDEKQLPWSYRGERGPHTWARHYPAASGNNQSPINIDTSLVRFSMELLHHPLVFDGSYAGKCALQNTGCGFHASVETDYHVSGGPLKHRYAFHRFHFHWGEDEHSGSEHHFDGISFAAEVQLIFWNTYAYKSISEALSSTGDPSAIVVVSIIHELGGRNPALDNIIRYVPAIPRAGDAVENITTINLDDFFPDHPEEYYTYSGSLTIPPCSEIVTWIIMRNKMTISSRQLDICRRLLRSSDKQGYSGTARPHCPLGNRIVLTSFR